MLNNLHPFSSFLQYQLLEQIGTGGQGVVWSALDKPHETIVAIKFNEISFQGVQNKDDLAFAQQTGRLAQLRHPHILPLTDFGKYGQIQYLVSSYMPGGTLQDKLRSNSFTVSEVLAIATEITTALDYLHANNVVHRDLKPSNVLLDLSQNTYVADFGLARVISTTTEVLHTGRGTPPYAPPEQHAMARMTPKSDIFSFGVMLYELFTGQLPWKGEKALGMQQLYSKDELPDPREIVPDLPPQLVVVLRAMTSADPESRPPSAREALRVLLGLFQHPAPPVPTQAARDEAALRRTDAQLLLKHSLAGWTLSQSTALSLTKFALIDTALRQPVIGNVPVEVLQFMLLHALTYGYDDDFWWSKLSDPRERLFVSNALLQRHIETVGARVVQHLTHDPKVGGTEHPIPPETTASLLELATQSNDPFLQEQGLDALKILIPVCTEWRELAFSPEQDDALAHLALTSVTQSGKAAELIGRLRSRRAVKAVLQSANEEQRSSALLAIQQAAGSLPTMTPARVRLGVSAALVFQRLFNRPWRLVAAYALAFLGAALGFGTYAYLAYSLRYPGHLLDMVGINASITIGIYLGICFGLGLALTRQIASRFWGKSALQGTLLAGTIGGVVLSVSLYVYDVLALNTPPTGLIAPAGCLWTALGFAVAARLHSRLAQIGLCLAALFTALTGTWWFSLTFASRATDLPILSFDPGPVLLILGWTLLISVPPAILSNLINLTEPVE